MIRTTFTAMPARRLVLAAKASTAAAFAQAASSRPGWCLSARCRTPCAARSRYKALSSSSPLISAWQAGPIPAAVFRHHAGVRIWNAIFSGG